MPPKKDSTRINDLLASVTADLLEGGPQAFQDNSPLSVDMFSILDRGTIVAVPDLRKPCVISHIVPESR